jgi:hypothetical protein
VTAIVVSGALLAASIATWIWTWWWNRYVVTPDLEEPDYDAAMTVLTLELVAWRARIKHFEPAHALLEDPTHIPLFATRQTIARKVVDAANREEKP